MEPFNRTLYLFGINIFYVMVGLGVPRIFFGINNSSMRIPSATRSSACNKQRRSSVRMGGRQSLDVRFHYLAPVRFLGRFQSHIVNPFADNKQHLLE